MNSKVGVLFKNNDSLFFVFYPRKCQHFFLGTKMTNFPKPSTHSLSVFHSLIFVHIPLTSLSPAINILHVRLNESKGFSCFMEKKEEKMGEVSIDRWGVNVKKGGVRELGAFAGV